MNKDIIVGQINIIIQIVNQNMFPKEWRIGQAVFNMCYANFPQQVDTLRGTDKDCFHNNDKIQDFINGILEQYEN